MLPTASEFLVSWLWHRVVSIREKYVIHAISLGYVARLDLWDKYRVTKRRIIEEEKIQTTWLISVTAEPDD
jgi:hypothetical protein